MTRRPRKPRLDRSRLTAFALTGLTLGGLFGMVAGRSAPPPPRATPSVRPVAAVPSPMQAKEQTILVMATDAMGGHGRHSLDSNTDSILLVHVNPAERRVGVLAIPRDTRVPIAGHGTFKVNAANAYGGPELARSTLERFVGIPIDRYLLLNLRGVRALVDAIGGVEVTIPKRVKYQDHAGNLYIDFQKGRQHLDGKQVESYLRFRHDDQGDIGRVQRQQAFLIEFSRQLLTPRHLMQVPAMWSTLKDHARTDLTAVEVMRLVQLFKQIKSSDIEMTYLPGREDSSAGWFWAADLAAVDAFLVRHFRKEPTATVPAHSPRITVENRTGLPRSALTAFLRQLEGAGYRIDDIRRAEPMDRSHVISVRGDRAGAQRLQELLGGGDVIVAAVGALSSEFTIQLGTDWVEQRGVIQ